MWKVDNTLWKIDNTREGRWGGRWTTPGRGGGVEDGQHQGGKVGWKIDNTREGGGGRLTTPGRGGGVED